MDGACLDVVAVEAHEDDVDDDAERDGQLHEGVEHHEGKDLAQLHAAGWWVHSVWFRWDRIEGRVSKL